MKSLEQSVKQLIAEALGVREEGVKLEARLVEDLGADSLDSVELVMACEEAFCITIPDEDAEKILTVQQVVDYVKSHT